MEKQRKSQLDIARVQNTINLIRSIPTIKSSQVTNLVRKLTPEQYEKVLRALEDPEDHRLSSELKEKLRFDYTSQTGRFEIRLRTIIQGGLVSSLAEEIFEWRRGLKHSNDNRISDAAKSIRLIAGWNLRLASSRGVRDAKSPDWAIMHKCSHRCPNPTLVFEISWSETKEDLRKKADTYIRCSNGEIRTVVAVCMNEMFKAEQKNERRLERMFREGDVDINGPYAYWEDGNNQTGSASILVWRAIRQRDGTVQTGNVEEKIFRDTEGSAIQSASLQLCLQDFICAKIVDSPSMDDKLKAPFLEISPANLCGQIQTYLDEYRRRRSEEVKDNSDNQNAKTGEEKEKNE